MKSTNSIYWDTDIITRPVIHGAETEQFNELTYVPMVHLAKNGLRITDVEADGRTQYQVRDTSTGREYYAAFVKRAGVYLIQPLEWLFDVGRFEPEGEPAKVMPGVEIIGTVTDIYRLHRVPNAFDYEREAAAHA